MSDRLVKDSFSSVAYVAVLLFVSLGAVSPALAQWTPTTDLPAGEVVRNTFTHPAPLYNLEGFVTQHSLYTVDNSGADLKISLADNLPAILWEPPNGAEISGLFWKTDSSFRRYPLTATAFVVTSDGHLHKLDLIVDASAGRYKLASDAIVTPPPGTTIKELQGDDLYVIGKNNLVYVSRDNAQTWSLDTAGLRGATPNTLALDSNQTVYLASSTGIYSQALTSNTWQLQKSGYYTHVWCPNHDQLFAAGLGSLLQSTNGTDWTDDGAGLGGATVKLLASDTSGTLYAVTNDYIKGDRIAVQFHGHSWQFFDWPNSISADTSAAFINDISVPKGVMIGTNYGLFYTEDDGRSWQTMRHGVPATNIYSYLKVSGGRSVITTSLGLYTKDAGDTMWTKRLPVNGYMSKLAVTEDNIGYLYTFGASHNGGPKDLYFSPDQGTTWAIDTVGNYAMHTGIQFVDESGTQHLAFNYNGLKVYQKPRIGQWIIDTARLAAASSDMPSVFTSDRNGHHFLAITNGSTGDRLVERPVGSSWTGVELDPQIKLPYACVATKDGKLVVGNNNTAMGYWQINKWTVMPMPTGLNNPSGYPQSVDSAGNIWAIFGNIDQNYFYTSYGTYWTSDFGQHWTQAYDGSANFTTLVSFGDTTYGLNSGKGLYAMTTSSGGAAVSESSEPAVDVVISPNPAHTTVSLTLNNITCDRIELVDVLGNTRIVSSAQFSTDDMPSGIYIVRITGTNIHGRTVLLAKQLVIAH